MMVSTRLATGADGRPVLVKEGPGLGREAEVLAAARHPGVVEVESWEPDAERLVLRFVGSRTLADLRPPVETAAAIGAALAATVADLHAMGIRHGRITPSRVVLDGGGRPVLCGFASAALRNEDGPTAADDVAGVGAVLRSLAGVETELEPIPERRVGRRRAWPGALRRALLTLADQATHDDPARRPTARSLAAAVADLVPPPTAAGARRDRRRPPVRLQPASTPVEAPAHERAAEPGGGQRRLLVGAVAGVGLLAFGTASVLASPSDPTMEPVSLPVPVPVTPTSSPPAEVAVCPPVEPGGLAVDHDGDGCTSSAIVGEGVVEVAGVRYGVGEPGDTLVLGDWDCDGSATVAVVRPRTGEVFVFDAWGEVVAPLTARVAGATRAEAIERDGDGCDDLVVYDAAGVATEVPV